MGKPNLRLNQYKENLETIAVMEQFGRDLKRLREAQNLTKVELAAICSLSKEQINRLETGQAGNMGLHTLRLISKALNYYDWNLYHAIM